MKSELRLSKMIDLTIAAEKQSAQEEKMRMDRDPINSPSQKKSRELGSLTGRSDSSEQRSCGYVEIKK